LRIAITGAATGIGASVAARLKSSGHFITAYDVAEPKRNIDQWIKTDLNDPLSIESAISETKGRFDALINNAGVPPIDGRAAQILNINFLGFRQFLDGMLGSLSPDASIVNTASRAGAMWRDNLDQVKALLEHTDMEQTQAFINQHKIDHVRAYNLSKEAMIVYTMANAERMLEYGYRMNSVSPAAVSTDILDDFKNAFGDKVAQNLKRVGRAGAADEIAEVIVFMAMPESIWLKGIDIVVDGGMTAMATSDALGL